MNFKLPRQIFPEELASILFREVKKQKVAISKLSKRNLKELSDITRIIEKQGLPDYLVCQKLPGGLGHGIFLHPKAKPISAGQVIAPYAGICFITSQNVPEGHDDSCYVFSMISDILLTKEEQRLLDPQHAYHPRRLYSLDLDARETGNFTRFINHSPKPNVEALLTKIPSRSSKKPFEILYMAQKTIQPGQQLLVSYEGEAKSYWGKVKPTPITPDTFRLDESLKIRKKPCKNTI